MWKLSLFFLGRASVTFIILQAKKFLKCDWLRQVVFKPNLKYLHIKITPVSMVTEKWLFLILKQWRTGFPDCDAKELQQFKENAENSNTKKSTGCLPFTWRNRLVDGLCKWKAKFPYWKFPFGVACTIWTTDPTYRKSLGRLWHLQNGGWNRCIQRDYRCFNWRVTTSHSFSIMRKMRIPLNISHCSFHEERSEENCWFLWGCGAVLRNRWVQIVLSNDQNQLRSSCTLENLLENRTLSSSHVDSSHVTQLKNGVWPGTGFEWQMVSTFSVRILRLGILDYLSRRSVYFGKFPFGQTKTVLPFTSQPKFPDFFGKW